MLIYEKTIDGVRHLFGTLGNIPSNDDPQLMYKDASGKEIDNIKDFKLFYGTNKEMKGSLQFLPTDSDTIINVFIGDTMVIGSGDAPAEEPGIYYYDEETGEPYLAMTWAEVKETFSDAFIETEEGMKIIGILSNNTSYFATIEEPFKIVIYREITSIGDWAFATCENLTSVTIPDGVTSIGSYAFNSCVNLTTVTVPNSVITVGERVFDSCYVLESVTLPNSITNIGEGAFSENGSLENIDIPDNITILSDNVFYGCLKFTDIVVPEGVTLIGRSAFYYCTSLASITIPHTVNEIGEQAFYLCSALTDINYNGTKTQWGDITFDNSWDSDTGSYTVHCTDGDIPKQ